MADFESDWSATVPFYFKGDAYAHVENGLFSPDFVPVSTALNGNGTLALVGNSVTSSAYEYQKVNGLWGQKVVFANPNGTRSKFGSGVAVTPDGMQALISSPAANVTGIVNYYTKTDGVWTLMSSFQDPNAAGSTSFGRAVTLTSDGSAAFISTAHTSGPLVSHWTRTGNTWTYGQDFRSSNYTSGAFAQAIACSADGHRVFANYNGAVYVFEANGSSWAEVAEISEPGVTIADSYGLSLATDATGEWLYVGAYMQDSNTGGLYIYHLEGGVWTKKDFVRPSNSAQNTSFGKTVAVAGDLSSALVSARVSSGDASGWVYTFF